MSIIEEGWTVFQAASLLYYGEAIVRDTASVESYVFEIDEVELIYVPWTHVQGARDRFTFHMYQWEDRKGRLVEGWQVTDEASERILLHGMKREGDEVPFRMEYDMNGQIQPVEVVLREMFIQGTQIVLRGLIDREKVSVHQIELDRVTVYHWMYDAHYGQGLVEWFVANERPLEPMVRGEWFHQGTSTVHPFH